MGLRKSPVRTAALLAANRANAAQSTGPRTLEGKRRSAGNALRHGYRSRARSAAEPQAGRDRAAFEAFLETLRVAFVLKRDAVGERCLHEKALPLWRAKRLLDRWLERHPWPVTQPDYLTPGFLSVIFERPDSPSCEGWRVKVSVTVRWGRSPSCLMLRGLDCEGSGRAWRIWRSRRGRAHTVVSVTCTGHPWTRAWRQRLPTNPECHRKGEAWKNVMEDFETNGTGDAVGPRDFGIRPATGSDHSGSEPGTRGSRLGHASHSQLDARPLRPSPQSSQGRGPADGSRPPSPSRRRAAGARSAGIGAWYRRLGASWAHWLSRSRTLSRLLKLDRSTGLRARLP